MCEKEKLEWIDREISTTHFSATRKPIPTWCGLSQPYLTTSFTKIAQVEALESVMCDVIQICLKRRIATRSEKGNEPEF